MARTTILKSPSVRFRICGYASLTPNISLFQQLSTLVWLPKVSKLTVKTHLLLVKSPHSRQPTILSISAWPFLISLSPMENKLKRARAIQHPLVWSPLWTTCLRRSSSSLRTLVPSKPGRHLRWRWRLRTCKQGSSSMHRRTTLPHHSNSMGKARSKDIPMSWLRSWTNLTRRSPRIPGHSLSSRAWTQPQRMANWPRPLTRACNPASINCLPSIPHPTISLASFLLLSMVLLMTRSTWVLRPCWLSVASHNHVFSSLLLLTANLRRAITSPIPLGILLLKRPRRRRSDRSGQWSIGCDHVDDSFLPFLRIILALHSHWLTIALPVVFLLVPGPNRKHEPPRPVDLSGLFHFLLKIRMVHLTLLFISSSRFIMLFLGYLSENLNVCEFLSVCRAICRLFPRICRAIRIFWGFVNLYREGLPRESGSVRSWVCRAWNLKNGVPSAMTLKFG